MQHFFGRYFISSHPNWRTAELILAPPFLVNLRQIVYVLVEFIELDFNFAEEIAEAFLPFCHYSVELLRVDFDSIVKFLFN